MANYFQNIEHALLTALANKDSLLVAAMWQLFVDELGKNPDKLDINARDDDGHTLLSLVVTLHNQPGFLPENMVDQSLNLGASVHVIDKEGRSPLHIAAMNADVVMLDRLVTGNACLFWQTKAGQTVLDVAIQRQLETDAYLAQLLRITDTAEHGFIQQREVAMIEMLSKMLLSYCPNIALESMPILGGRIGTAKTVDDLNQRHQWLKKALAERYLNVIKRILFHGGGAYANFPKAFTHLPIDMRDYFLIGARCDGKSIHDMNDEHITDFNRLGEFLRRIQGGQLRLPIDEKFYQHVCDNIEIVIRKESRY